MDQYTDKLLIERIQKGELDLCGVLYERYKKVLFTYFYNHTKNSVKSEDLVQATFEKIVRYIKNFKGAGSFKSWMFSIGRNIMIDEYKKFQRREEAKLELTADEVFRAKGENGDRFEILQTCIDNLPKEKKDLIIMTKIEGMKYKEVCEIMNLTESNLKIKIFRIMNQLRKDALTLAAKYNI